MDIIQIQPVRLRIDLDTASQIVRRRKNAIHVDFIWFALADQAASRMAENGEMTVPHRAYHAFGLRLARKIKKRVHRSDHHVQLFERRIRQIEAAILENIDLNALEDGETLELGVQLVDFADLPCHAAPDRAHAPWRPDGCGRSAPCIHSRTLARRPPCPRC